MYVDTHAKTLLGNKKKIFWIRNFFCFFVIFPFKGSSLIE